MKFTQFSEAVIRPEILDTPGVSKQKRLSINDLKFPTRLILCRNCLELFDAQDAERIKTHYDGKKPTCPVGAAGAIMMPARDASPRCEIC